MGDLKIVGWDSFECEYPTAKLNKEELEKVVEIIKDEIADKGYVFAGEHHQYSVNGVPVFSDGTCFRASMRCWGSIMAEVYCDSDGNELSYMDFYTSVVGKKVMPPYEFVNVEPAVVKEESCGCTIKADRTIMQDALDAGIDFFTVDKVLVKKFALLKKEKGV